MRFFTGTIAHIVHMYDIVHTHMLHIYMLEYSEILKYPFTQNYCFNNKRCGVLII